MATFREWLDADRKTESLNRALTRLSVAVSVNVPTLYYAYRGARVAHRIAEKLRDHIRELGGDVSLESLVSGPSREQVRASGQGRMPGRGDKTEAA